MHAELMRYILGNHAAACQVPRHHFRFRGGLNLLASISYLRFSSIFETGFRKLPSYWFPVVWRRNCKLLWWLRGRRPSIYQTLVENQSKEETKVLACEQDWNVHGLPWGFWLLLRLSLMAPRYSGVTLHFLSPSSRPAVFTCSYSAWIRLLLIPQSLPYIYSKCHLTPFCLLQCTAWAEATVLYYLTYFQSLQQAFCVHSHSYRVLRNYF